MLSTLEVRDLAVIRSASLELGPGFTVLTGETGAGKSLLVDALGLVLGDRGNSGLVRSGADYASVTAEIALAGATAAEVALAQRGLPAENGLLLLHRQVSADGRSRAWINGVSVPLAALRQIGEGVVEIHGQLEHLTLARPRYQREILDAHAGTLESASGVRAAAEAVHATAAAAEAVRQDLRGRNTRLDFLRFQLQELDELEPREGDYAELMAEYERLRHGERIREALALALAALDDGEAPALAALAAATQALGRLPPAAGLGETVDLLGQTEALASEAVSRLRRIAEAEDQPERLDLLNSRIARYQALARKHDVEPEALVARRTSFVMEAAALDASEDALAGLEREYRQRQQQYRELANALSSQRRKAAPAFARAVTHALRELGMPQARFEVTLEPEETTDCPADGMERVSFRVTTNAGQPPGPVAEIASGGELSRLCLAVETLAGTGSGVPVMVFDEVDAGVSGRVAELVGLRLKTLSARRQVLCVTHLPQVAALADRHHSVSKTEESGISLTKVESLDTERRVEAIAQMLAGVQVTASARAHARELLLRAAGS